jgi:hypothetical protein
MEKKEIDLARIKKVLIEHIRNPEDAETIWVGISKKHFETWHPVPDEPGEIWSLICDYEKEK